MNHSYVSACLGGGELNCGKDRRAPEVGGRHQHTVAEEPHGNETVR